LAKAIGPRPMAARRGLSLARGRAANYDEHREAILARAAELFAQCGYAASSMNQVAAACGLSKATLYHYYRDKDSLLVSIADGHVSRLAGVVDEVLAQDLAPDATVRALVQRLVAEYAGAQHAHRVLTEDVRFLSATDRERILATERRIVAALAQAVVRWRPEHRDSGLAKPLTMLLFGMINWLFTWMKPGGALTHEAMAPIVADLFFGGVPAVRASAGQAPSRSPTPRRSTPRRLVSRSSKAIA
jgi:AcrR family transcriptional regulator